MYKVAIKVGHHEGAKGAYSHKLESSEWDYNLKVAKELVALSDDKVEFQLFTFDKSIGSYTKRQKAVADILNKKDFDLVIELHFDSAESQTAKGTTVLYYHKSEKGKQAAKIIGDQIYEDFKSHRRTDIELVNDKQNGYQAVVTPKAVAILLEPFFGSNPLDSVLFKGKDNIIKYAKSIKSGVLKYFLVLKK